MSDHPFTAPQAEVQPPSPGRIAFYSHPDLIHLNGGKQEAPAIVVAANGYLVNLHVFLDSLAPGKMLIPSTIYVEGVAYLPSPGNGSWRWPPRV